MLRALLDNPRRGRVIVLGALACAAATAGFGLMLRGTVAGERATELAPEVVQAIEQANAEAASTSLPAVAPTPAHQPPVSSQAQPMQSPR